MDTIEVARTFFGWCSVINIGLLAFSTIMLIAMRDFSSRLHAKMFGLDESDALRAYFAYLANYKIAVIVLNIVPWLALVLMG